MEIIGVDNGYGFTKTANTAFVTSLTKFYERKPALIDRTIFYEGNYYTIGGERKKAIADKTDDEETFIITLAGIAEELKIRGGITETDIVLAVGLPLSRCSGSTRTDFEEYFARHKEVYFEYEDVPYHITISKVIVSAQCVAGIVSLLTDKRIPAPSIVVDIGSWTTDILPIEKDDKGNAKPQIAKAISLNMGVISCMLACQNEINSRTGKTVQESQIQEIFRGNIGALPPKFSEIVQRTTREYVTKIAQTIEENGFDVETLPVTLMGGGSSIVKRYGGSEVFFNVNYMLNVRANAIGYERIAKQMYR